MKNNTKTKIIRVAILAEEPIGWGSGKHYFPIILDNYIWKSKDKTYKFSTQYIYDKDIIKGKLNTSNYDVLLVPGGGVGDGESMTKGLYFLPSVVKWKKNISSFIKNGGGYVGICGGAILCTDLKIEGNNKPVTFLEKLYNNSSIDVSCFSSFYKSLAYPIFYLFQKTHPEKIGATAYVFSFAPGETKNGTQIFTGGVPIDFQICKDNPIFSDYPDDTLRIRWWGGSALIVPEKKDREIKILARYPKKEISEDESTKINAWKYTGGIWGLLFAFFNALKFIKKEKDSLKNVFLYSYYFAGNWELTDKIIDLDYSNKPSITTEIYPNVHGGRILLCTSHPEYMVWWNGHIEEMKNTNFNCLASGLHKWKDITPLSDDINDELTYTWWLVRRFIAWAGKVPNNQLPPIEKEKIGEKEKSLISNNILYTGSLKDQMKNI